MSNHNSIPFIYYRIDNGKTVNYRQAQSKEFKEKRKKHEKYIIINTIIIIIYNKNVPINVHNLYSSPNINRSGVAQSV
jgi:hypothetical protein